MRKPAMLPLRYYAPTPEASSSNCTGVPSHRSTTPYLSRSLLCVARVVWFGLPRLQTLGTNQTAQTIIDYCFRTRGRCKCSVFHLARKKSRALQGYESTKSGDNAALIALLETRSLEEMQQHVRVAPQCAMNSYLWRNSPLQMFRWFRNPAFMIRGLWRPGDFVLHLAGFSNKVDALQRLDGRWRQSGIASL
jgi:hypothetical protein